MRQREIEQAKIVRQLLNMVRSAKGLDLLSEPDEEEMEMEMEMEMETGNLCDTCKHNIALESFRVCAKRKLIRNPRIGNVKGCKKYTYRYEVKEKE